MRGRIICRIDSLINQDHYQNKYLILNRPDNMQAYGTEGGDS